MITRWHIPDLAEIRRARERLRLYLSPTPLLRSPGLSDLLGCQLYVKHENHQPTGAFKVRGGINLVSQLDESERTRGIVTASTGNHGQSIAYAGHLFGVRVRIVVPRGNNPDKNAAMQRLGAELIEHGVDFDEARLRAEELAARYGYRYVHSANEPLLIAGTATIGLEILEAQPEIETIIVAVGGGHGASGIALAAKRVTPTVRVIAAQSEAAPAGYLSWRDQQLISLPAQHTFAEGLATRYGFELPQIILRELLDDFVLVSDREIKQAVLLHLQHTHNLAEGAGAATLAAAVKLRGQLKGRNVAIVLSGCNITLSTLKGLFEEFPDGASIEA